ncbi:hypothetical protein GCM10011418_23010 [Sphingobacterium alkalisoli]|uniref:phosphoribosyltransferase-like protein n=1 Tax=Sphingobacterium alkalisoli TaxID=1874115 RepID=UPI0019B50FD0|nr:hypothetical protein GCM10011418_23010 [Sphingobacterium alkalisoli]
MIEKFAASIHHLIRDYRTEDGIQISPDSIIAWASQFGDDALFILSELSHILPQMYISKQKAKQFILQHINWLINRYGYRGIHEFLSDTEFLKIQQDGKKLPGTTIALRRSLKRNLGEYRHCCKTSKNGRDNSDNIEY